MADRIGQQLGNYRLDQLLGSGGFAEVYLGTHVHLGTQAAVKLLQTHFATAGEIEKFRMEAQTIAALQHPHIVRLVDFGVEAGTPYLVLDYAPNGSLRQRFPPGSRLSPATILPAVLQVASALQYAHEQKLVHRDVKPENLLLGRKNDVLLTDFGIATVAQSTSQQRTEGVAGTAAYMAPEQLQGKPRPASDLYALGIVVYEWLCGERPFVGGPLEVATQHLTVPPPPLREKVPGIPPAIEQVVLTALAKDPKERFGTVRAFANAFQQACRDAGLVYVTSTQPITPPAPASQPTLSLSQASTVLSNPPAQPDAPPGGQVAQAGASLFSAPTHLTPQVSAPPAPAGQVGQAGPSLFSAPTILTPPAPAPAQRGMDSSSTLPPLAGPGTGAPFPSSAPGETTPTTPPPGQGWAAPISASGSGAALLTTAEVAYPTGRPGKPGEERALAKTPLVPGVHTPETGKRRRKGGVRRWVLAAAACLVVLALIGSGVLAFIKLIPHSPAPSTAATGATVTITPESLDVKNSFNLTGVTGTPDPSQQQVGARMISVTTPAHSTTVNATGQKNIPGTHASGILDVQLQNATVTFTAGTVYPNTLGCGPSIHMVIDQTVTINGPSFLQAHVAEIGTIGNIPVYCNGTNFTFDYQSPAPNNFMLYPPQPFSGGTDPQSYTVVAQSDIDTAANNLIQANQPNAQQVVQGQLQQGEQLVGTPQCQPTTSANHRAGDQASQVTVTVSFTCTGEAYDHAGALALAKQLLTSQAATTPGAGYALVGQIKTTLVSATPDNQGGVAIVVQAEGIWASQFSASQQQALARLVAGKKKQDAMSVLATQTGVAQARIQIQGGTGQTLPPDPQKITLVIQPVSGL